MVNLTDDKFAFSEMLRIAKEVNDQDFKTFLFKQVTNPDKIAV
jgi:hypothetical protein